MFRKHERVTLDCGGLSVTRQEFKAECDINTIMARYYKTGVISHMATSQPRFIDFEEIPDFQSAMNMMIEAESAFMSLPATVRKEFDNDPAAFVQYASDKENLPKLREWGLAPPEKAPDAPMRVEVVNPSAPPSGS